ncbi:hypothetical protein BJ508DRAFT_410172 [Ascobolus immersus RN42]|uniref:F-box domain-containing protein n=1 Tax=Ascobolus immersus RN42 TaxID=1160509 RepID=A0A3N4IRN2_ASCIM|nr:hypothetical protein BJ508DRAFT_410172 [Ascobolus immersus RN42]
MSDNISSNLRQDSPQTSTSTPYVPVEIWMQILSSIRDLQTLTNFRLASKVFNKLFTSNPAPHLTRIASYHFDPAAIALLVHARSNLVGIFNRRNLFQTTSHAIFERSNWCFGFNGYFDLTKERYTKEQITAWKSQGVTPTIDTRAFRFLLKNEQVVKSIANALFPYLPNLPLANGLSMLASRTKAEEAYARSALVHAIYLVILLSLNYIPIPPDDPNNETDALSEMHSPRCKCGVCSSLANHANYEPGAVDIIVTGDGTRRYRPGRFPSVFYDYTPFVKDLTFLEKFQVISLGHLLTSRLPSSSAGGLFDHGQVSHNDIRVSAHPITWSLAYLLFSYPAGACLIEMMKRYLFNSEENVGWEVVENAKELYWEALLGCFEERGKEGVETIKGMWKRGERGLRKPTPGGAAYMGGPPFVWSEVLVNTVGDGDIDDEKSEEEVARIAPLIW